MVCFSSSSCFALSSVLIPIIDLILSPNNSQAVYAIIIQPKNLLNNLPSIATASVAMTTADPKTCAALAPNPILALKLHIETAVAANTCPNTTKDALRPNPIVVASLACAAALCAKAALNAESEVMAAALTTIPASVATIFAALIPLLAAIAAVLTSVAAV